MEKRLRIFGDVNNKVDVTVNTDQTINEILVEYAGGMINSKKLKMVQIGGPLGKVLGRRDLNYKLSKYSNDMDVDTIMYLNDLVCPVDFVRFCGRYVMRELGIKSDYIKRLNNQLEEIVSGIASEEVLETLKEDELIKSKNEIENKLKNILLYMIQTYETDFVKHIIDKKCETGICRKLFKAQCINACPAEVNVPGYVALMAENRVTDAYNLIKETNPLPFVCGMVCSRPCEDRCRRGEIEKTVGVRALKRYAAQKTLNDGVYIESKLDLNGKTVAIIGAGPAGLTSAYYLAKTGYEVTVYEASGVIGGMLAMGIPEYRLPQEVIDKEVNQIRSLGVKFVKNTKIGKDIKLSILRNNFDAVLLTTGAHIGNRFGPNIKGIETAIDLLREVKTKGRINIGENVVVLGGGDVAMDTARTSVRLGAKSVVIITLESYETMVATESEKEEALEEGISLINGYGIKDIEVKDESLVKLVLNRCVSMFDEMDEFNPKFNIDDTKEITVDHLIMAIGQKPELTYIDEDIDVNNNGCIKVNPRTFKTTGEGVFAAGDIYKSGVAIKAIAEAKIVAQSIDSYLGGVGLFNDNHIEIPSKQLSYDLWFDKKVDEKTLNASERMSNFKDVSFAFTDAEAKSEASRCLRCDLNTRKS